MAGLPAFTVRAPAKPADPATGGHYTQVAPGQFQLIHAVAPGKWTPGPPPSAKSGIVSSSPLLNPNATLSGQDLYTAAQSLAQAQTQPAITQLLQQIAQNNRQTTGAENLTGQYFNQLGQQAQQGVTDEQNISSGLNSQLAQLGQQETQGLQGIGQNAVDSFNKYAPQSDAQHSLAQPALAGLTAEIARQQGLAAQQQGNMAAYGAKQGANYAGLAASNLGSFAKQGQQDLSQIAQAGQVKNQPLTGKIAQLDQTYGADLATALGKLRQQEITNQISRAGLGIKQAAVNATVADNVRNNQTSSANNQRTTQTSAANNLRTTQTSTANNIRTTQTSAANNAANNAIKQEQLNPNQVGSPAWYRTQQAAAKAAGGTAKPLSPNENNSWFKNLGTVEQLVQDGHSKGLTTDQIKAMLGNGQNPSKKSYDPVMIEASLELLGYGSIDQTTATNMHNMGLRGGTFRGQPIKVTANYKPTPANTLASIPGVGGML